MSFKLFSYCPFRVQTQNHQAGCTLQFGTVTNCYTQEQRPLIRKKNLYFCPKIGIYITLETYNELETLLTPLMQIQDEFEIAINVWPTVKGIANPRKRVETHMGNNMVELARHIQDKLSEIVLELD